MGMKVITPEIDREARNIVEGIIKDEAPSHIERANDEDPGYGHGFMHSEGEYYCPFK